VIETLARFPDELVTHRFAELAEDRTLSPRMRDKFRELASGYRPF
jgi:hypothetical protein